MPQQSLISNPIVNLLLGGIIGILGKILYDKIQENTEIKRVKLLLSTEMKSNLNNAREILKNIQNIESSPVKDHLEPYNLEETAELILKSCKKEVYAKCLEKLPLLGQETMETIFSFYNAFEGEAKFLRDYPRFGGNISTHTCENVVDRLILTSEEIYANFSNNINRLKV